MRVAIVGGGAAGLTSAYLLDAAHEVSLFEREAVLGGHVRTLGGNLKALPEVPYPLDAGVIEFERTRFPRVTRLFRRLGVPTQPVPATTTFFPREGGRLLAPGAIAQARLSRGQRLRAWASTLACGCARAAFLYRTRHASETLYTRSAGDFLSDGRFDRWLALLTMYAYSTPLEEVRSMSAALVVPMLREFVEAGDWIRVVGGTHRYVQAIATGLRGQVVTNARLRRIRRCDPGVEIDFADGTRQAFDAAVLALPPGDVLSLLCDPTDREGRRFAPWRTRRIETWIHDDPGPYLRRGADFASEFDVFELGGSRGGYNALLNRLSGVPADEPRHFGLAFAMGDEIDPRRVLHRQSHRVPIYSQPALASREEIRATNGERNTFYAGAWLGDGLHEGAVQSALEVAKRLGGAVL